MHELRRELVVLPPSAPLCRADGHTCAGCCHGDRLGRPSLAAKLRRQTALFRRCFPSGRRPTALALAGYEVAARGGIDLVLALLLCIPLVADLLRPWLRRRLACAFLGFEDAGETRVGCLLHPTRWSGEERRPQSAFRLLRGLGCGTPDHFCLPALLYRHADWRERASFRQQAAGLDWFAFGRMARRFAGTRHNSRFRVD